MNIRAIHPVFLMIGLLGLSYGLWGQNIAINSTGAAPNTSSIVDISAASQGILIPRMNDIDRKNIKSPASGLMIYNTTTNEFNYWNGSNWDSIPRTAVSNPVVSGTGPGGGIAINNSGNIPDPSAILDMASTSRGLLIPRTTTDAVTAVAGMIIYNSCTNVLNWYNGSSWQAPCAELIDNNTGGAGATVNGIGINSTGAAPDASAILDISSANQGLLIPRMSAITRDNINTPAQGLMIYDNTNNVIEYWTGTGWYKMDNTSWTQLCPVGTPPPASYGSTAVWDATDKVMIVFGGYNAGSDYNDVWAYDPAANTWTQKIANGVAGSPTGREGAGSVWDPVNDTMYMFGGGNPGGPYSAETWAYSYSGNTWKKENPVSSPPSGDQITAVWDPTDSKILIFGGYNGARFNAVWAYDPATVTWTNRNPASPPLARNGNIAVWDATDKMMIIFGGGSCCTYYNDVWGYSYTTNSWTNFSPAGTLPIGRQALVSAWDPLNDNVYIYGGNNGSALNDLWAYSVTNNAWTQIPICAPTVGRWQEPGIWNPINNVMCIFGGASGAGGYLSDLWQR